LVLRQIYASLYWTMPQSTVGARDPKNIMRYPIAIEQGTDDTAWGVAVLDLPGCFSAGDTFDEAMDNAAEAIAMFLEDVIDEGNPIARPGSINDYLDQYKGWIWAFVAVPAEALDTRKERVNITLPKRGLRRIDAYAGDEQRSSFLAHAAIMAMRTSKSGITTAAEKKADISRGVRPSAKGHARKQNRQLQRTEPEKRLHNVREGSNGCSAI
jgi:predicted RNase H-like HicB family nuclease